MADNPKPLADFPSVPAKAPVHNKAVQFPSPGNNDVIRGRGRVCGEMPTLWWGVQGSESEGGEVMGVIEGKYTITIGNVVTVELMQSNGEVIAIGIGGTIYKAMEALASELERVLT